MADLWRASKSRLVTKIRLAPNEEERLKLRPDNIKSKVEWKAFIREKTNAEFQDLLEEQKRDATLSSTTSVKEDILSKVLSPDNKGTVRDYGRGVTHTKLAIISEREMIILFD
ncbi:hypothetical protein PanWU01x14_198420 [Parasponia andersonii]|uniref:Uncharacterized protein n=1 Tax=Parasponia andersonii TaxID=3476 RepID=A0A2P5BYT4_PARAD|nr:hypothetical protein PanWU01x14_198420 [Parasponia andersonii]